MCCLFGFVNYSGKKNPGVNELVNCLAQEATIRGVDSTGIAYNKDGKLTIYKKPLSAYEMVFKGVEDCVCVTGHTRHATQGSNKKNYNNHPFMGKCLNAKFALSHNGVLWNDKVLQRQYAMPKDKIETDSFVAVQLLQHFRILTADNVARMAEAVSGSFTFTMVDTNDKLWIVKGDSPLAIVHFPYLKLYVYASTKNILFSAISQTNLVDEIADGDFEMVEIRNGEIMQIAKDGTITRSNFKVNDYSGYNCNWESYGCYGGYGGAWESEDYYGASTYLEDLKAVARSRGFLDEDVDDLIKEGFTYDEIEEFLYSY